MHALHTTQAFVLGSYPHGESNRVYKLLTRDLGLLYAHAQSVRELKSRNRYALQIGAMPTVTLVRGREVWRITSAQHDARSHNPHTRGHVLRILRTIGRFAPVDASAEDLFFVVEEAVRACSENKDQALLVEVVAMLRIMDRLGYVARPLEESAIADFLAEKTFTPDLLCEAQKYKKTLVQRVNIALEEAQ